MANKDLPKFDETFNPILEILSDGKIIHHRELLKKVFEKHYSDLPKELLDQKTQSGELLILNRIAWGRSYLKKGVILSTQNEVWYRLQKKELNQFKINYS